MSHFSASSHLEGKLFLGRPELKEKTGLPGVEGASNSLLCCETEWPLLSALPLGTGRDLTNSEVSFRLSLQRGSGKSSAKGLSLLFPYMFTLLSASASCITKTSEKKGFKERALVSAAIYFYPMWCHCHCQCRRRLEEFMGGEVHGMAQ